MALAPGVRLGPYEVLSRIGAGGMGEVWKARDTKLNRDVALKVLPEAFTLDPERIARLTREAQVLASLNHSNIAAIHGFEDGSAAHALVLELVEGATLADRIASRALPVDDAVSIARQIADALEAAHELGVVHRDLKPSNIKVRPDGTVKVLDFGLAKALDLSAGPGAVHGLSQSPTITSPAMTRAGVVLGTAAYMSPEQARGRQADRRSDVWAFGCVLFEMLTGHRAFEGEEVSDTMAAVLRADPPWTDLPAATPASLRRLLRRCLEKDPKRRLADIRDARLELDEAGTEGAAADTRATSRPAWRERLAWGVAVLAIVAAAVVSALLWQRSAPRQEAASQFLILAPENTAFASDAQTLAVSPDGRAVVFAAAGGAEPARLWVRPLESLAARTLAGTDGARMPFWSPDSKSIGFFADGKLKRVSAQGGPVQALADVDVAFQFGGTWNSDGVILYAPGFGRPIHRIPAGGGPSVPVTQMAVGMAFVHGAPFFLPDGRHFVFSKARSPTAHDIQLASLDSAEAVKLVDAESLAIYASGHLLYVKGGILMAHPFDADRLALTGDPIPVSGSTAFVGDVSFSASVDGTLLYRPQSLISELVWLDRKGTRTGVAAPAAGYSDVELSKDGKRVAFTRWGVTGNQDVWVSDLERQITFRFTTQPPLNNVPIWSPDGRTIAFATARNGALDIYQREVGSTGDDQAVLKLAALPIVFPSDWSRDGHYLMYYRSDDKTQLDTWVLPLTGDRAPRKVLGSDFNESQGQFAPSGKWLAYVSDESSQQQVYVQAFPEPAQRVQVSTAGGTQPRWGPDGRELFYLSPDGRLMTVSVQAGDTFNADAPRPLFATRLNTRGLRQTYAVSPDGQRFLLVLPTDVGVSTLTVVLNWPALLAQRR